MATALGIVAGKILHHDAPQILFWAALNTFFMLGFFIFEMTPSLVYLFKKSLKMTTEVENIEYRSHQEMYNPIFLEEEKF
jgi:hypothetical protein